MDTSKSYYGIVRLKFASSVYSYLRWCWCLRWGRYLGEWVGRVCLISRFVPTQTSFSAALLPGGQQDGTESHLVLLTYLRETILKGRGWARVSLFIYLSYSRLPFASIIFRGGRSLDHGAGRVALGRVVLSRVVLDAMLATRDLLSLSDDELQLVHEALPGAALWSCVRCCKRLRTAALASGGLALAAAAAGDLASVKWAHLRGCPLARDTYAGVLCQIAAGRNDFRTLRWALANGGVDRFGSLVMELAIAVGNLELVRFAHGHGCVYDRDYETAAITGHLAIIQWFYDRDSQCSEQLRRSRMTSAAGCAAAHGKLPVLEWVTDERVVPHPLRISIPFLGASPAFEQRWASERIAASRSSPEVPASWGRYLLSAGARGGHLHVVRWARRAGYEEGEETEEEWIQAAKLAWAAAKRVDTHEATLPGVHAWQKHAPSKMSFEAGMYDEFRQILLDEANEVNALVASSALLLRGSAHEHVHVSYDEPNDVLQRRAEKTHLLRSWIRHLEPLMTPMIQLQARGPAPPNTPL